MIPNFEFLGKTFSAYMFLALAGVLAALWFTYALARKKGLDEIHMLYMILFAFVGAVLGGHILYAVTRIDYVLYLTKHIDIINSFDDIFKSIQYIFGGSVFYGGLIGALIAGFIYMKKNRLESGNYSDVACLAIPLFHTFGRVGCFLSGCCYGIQWEYGFTYRYSVARGANGVPRFPVQIVEASLNLILFIVMYKLYKSGMLKSRLLAFYLLVYSVYRFILEFFRGDGYRGFIFGLSTSQIISILIFTGVIIILLCIKIKTKKQPQKAAGL